MQNHGHQKDGGGLYQNKISFSRRSPPPPPPPPPPPILSQPSPPCPTISNGCHGAGTVCLPGAYTFFYTTIGCRPTPIVTHSEQCCQPLLHYALRCGLVTTTLKAAITIDSCRHGEVGRSGSKVFYFNDLALAFGPYSAQRVSGYPGKNPEIWVLRL
jgi:hypothetical protein